MKFKVNKIIIFIIGVIFIPIQVGALEDNFNLMFNKINDDPSINYTYNNSELDEVHTNHSYNEYKLTSDGSYFLVGSMPDVNDGFDATFVAKISRNGDMIYTKKLDVITDQDDDGEGLVIINDIAYIFADPYLLKVDTNDGTLLKSVKLQLEDLQIADSQNLFYIDNQTLAMVTKNNNILKYNLELELIDTIHIDLDHNIELIDWRKQNVFFSKDDENNFIGMFFDFESNKYYQFDKNGNIIKEVAITEFDEFAECSFLKYKNGFVLVTIENEIVYYDLDGNFQWKINKNSSDDEEPLLIVSDDGNILIKLLINSEDTKDYVDTTFYNENGEKTNEDMIEFSYKFDMLSSSTIALTKDNYFLICGGVQFSEESNLVSFLSVYKNSRSIINNQTEVNTDRVEENGNGNSTNGNGNSTNDNGNSTNDNENNSNIDAENPNTGDNILINVITLLLSLISITILCIKKRKKNFNN